MKKIIYCFWTGKNEMSTQRLLCLEQMKRVSGVDVLCIYHDDIDKYILPEHPLHQAYSYLSETHKADYLRTYFMNFYGGGYSDIKHQTGDWNESFDLLENSDKLIIGYKETGYWGVAGDNELREKWQELIGNGAYICKPNTNLTNEWYTNLLKVLDTKLELLKIYPSKHAQDDGWQDNNTYPIGWSEILGLIFHKLVYKYKDKVLNSLPILNFGINYR